MKILKLYIIIISLILLGLATFVNGEPTLHLTDALDIDGEIISGNEQTGIVNKPLSNKIRVMVVDDESNHIEGILIHFEQVAGPIKCSKIVPLKFEPDSAYTDKYGQVASVVTLGNQKGEYHIEAILASDPTQKKPYHFIAYGEGWIRFLLFGLFGGLAIFLLGMKICGKSLQRAADNRLKSILGTLTKNRFIGMFIGIVITFLLQSSSAMTVMLVSFTNAGLMTL